MKNGGSKTVVISDFRMSHPVTAEKDLDFLTFTTHVSTRTHEKGVFIQSQRGIWVSIHANPIPFATR